MSESPYIRGTPKLGLIVRTVEGSIFPLGSTEAGNLLGPSRPRQVTTLPEPMKKRLPFVKLPRHPSAPLEPVQLAERVMTPRITFEPEGTPAKNMRGR